jgi:hypothetical protein
VTWWKHCACILAPIAISGCITRAPAGPLAQSYSCGFATYVGGSAEGQVRDVAVDRSGNVYIAGGTGSSDFPRTGGAPHQGSYDVFVVKYSSAGRLLWSRLIGGPNYDRAYAIEVDDRGYVYLGGRAGPGYPVTPGVVQARFGGDSNPNRAYGLQDGFVTKLSPDGAHIIWSTFFGGNDRGILRDIDVDDAGNVYGALTGNSVDNPHVSKGAFATKRPSPNFGVVAKISADGTKVLWASYLGGTDGQYAFGTPSIRVDDEGYVVVVSHAACGDMPTTAGAYHRTKAGQSDMHIAKFLPDGSDLVFATYLGGSDIEYGDTHNAALAADGSVIVAATTKSADFPVTEGAAQTRYGGSGGGYNQQGDGFIAKLSADGTTLLASTFYGGTSGEGLEGVAVDPQGSIYVSGGTYSTDMPITAAGRRPASLGPRRPDCCAAKFAPDLTRMLYSTCFGGSDWDLGLAVAVDSNGVFYMTGETKSADFPTLKPMDGSLSGGKNGLLVQFVP